MNFQPNSNFLFYLYFIQERMNMFWNRKNNIEPLTEDQILAENKFTNVYRVLDRSSQYLLKKVIYDQKGLDNERDTEDIFWRIILYKHFNLPSTWDALENELGEISLDTPNSEIVRFLKEYSKTTTVYSAAYLSTAAFMRIETTRDKYGLVSGMPKFELYLRIFEEDFINRGIMYSVLSSPTFEAAFNEIKKVVGVADFLAYQLIQDLNYSLLFDFDDNEFCAAGGGTQAGINRVFNIEGKPDYGQIVKWTQQNYHYLVDVYSKRMGVDLSTKQLNGWEMKVPDFSNCFCETDKYMRQLSVSAGDKSQGRMKQKFKPSSLPIDFVFPPKWGSVSL